MMEKIMQVRNGIQLLQQRCLPGDIKIRIMLNQMDRAMDELKSEVLVLQSQLKLSERQVETTQK